MGTPFDEPVAGKMHSLHTLLGFFPYPIQMFGTLSCYSGLHLKTGEGVLARSSVMQAPDRSGEPIATW